MEKAIHITKTCNLKYFKKGAFRRIYWGAEFCQNLIPGVRDTAEALDFAKRNNLGFTLMTPFIAEDAIKKIENLLEFLCKKVKCEVVLNDWGIAEMLRQRFPGGVIPVLGRLLVRQQRDPAIENAVRKQPPVLNRLKNGKRMILFHRLPGREYFDWVRNSYIGSSAMQRILKDFRIGRIELNNVAQGFDFSSWEQAKSLYTPWVNISTTRFCPMETLRQKIYRINVCAKECQRQYDLLDTGKITLLKRGNTLFYFNPVDQARLKGKGVDRLVFQPELPF
jgi:hypothetical protein